VYQGLNCSAMILRFYVCTYTFHHIPDRMWILDGPAHGALSSRKMPAKTSIDGDAMTTTAYSSRLLSSCHSSPLFPLFESSTAPHANDRSMTTSNPIQSSTNLFRRLTWQSSILLSIRLADDTPRSGGIDRYYVGADPVVTDARCKRRDIHTCLCLSRRYGRIWSSWRWTTVSWTRQTKGRGGLKKSRTTGRCSPVKVLVGGELNHPNHPLLAVSRRVSCTSTQWQCLVTRGAEGLTAGTGL